MSLRPAALLLLLLASLMLGGCAALGVGGEAPAAAAPAASAAAAVPGAAASAPASASLEVVGPPALKALLERYLDVARVGSLSGGEIIDETEWTRLIDATPAQARSLLQTEGYFAPQITMTRDIDFGNPAQRRVRLLLEPGPRTQVSRVTLEAEGELERAAGDDDAYARGVLDEFRARWALPAGAPFRDADWSSAKAGALAYLRGAGYASAVWSGTGAEVDPETHFARLFLVADSGPLFRFGKLQVKGLVEHDLQTVENLAGFPVGTPVTETLLLDYQERLQKSGLFDSVTVTLDPDTETAAAADIAVRLREAPLQVYTVGLGISANTGPRATVEHMHRRVFGRALTSRNRFEVGGLRQAWDGEIATHPGADQYRNLLGGAVERLESDDDIVSSQRLRLGRTQETQRIDRLYFVEAERSSRRTLVEPATRTDTLALSLNYHGVWRRLDSYLLPTRGYSLSLQGGVGHSRGRSSDNGPFARVYGRLTAYLPVGDTWYGQARVELGQVAKRSSVAVPESQLFRAGGDESVRGYGYRDLGPMVDGAVSGGSLLFTSSVELARPISAAMPSLWGAAFIDVGNAANSFRSLDPELGYGVGVRWRSPVGPLRLDYAWAPALSQGRIHFSVGISF